MRIKHIYITKEGEPMANPYMEYPVMEDYDCVIGWIGIKDQELEETKAKYHSGLLPFEDVQEAKDNLPKNAWIDWSDELKKDTLIPVDLEVEVVEQTQSPNQLNWSDCKTITGKIDGYKFRSVLRIKP